MYFGGRQVPIQVVNHFSLGLATLRARVLYFSV